VTAKPIEELFKIPVDSEKLVLGMLLNNADLLDEIDGFSQRFFWSHAHQTVFASIADLRGRGHPVDPVAVFQWMIDRQLSKDVRPDYLLELKGMAWTRADQGMIKYHAGVVMDKAKLRSLAYAGRDVSERAAEGHAPADEILEYAERQVLEIAEQGVSSPSAEPLAVAIDESLKLMNRRSERPDADGIKTGLTDFDRLTGGFHDSELVIVAARPSVGKSSIARHFAMHAAESGLPVFLVSLEMSKSEIGTQLICTKAEIDSSLVRRGKVLAPDVRKLIEAANELSLLPVQLDATANQRIDRIASNARRLKRRCGLRLLVVDYLQLIDPDNPRENRERQVSDISRKLKLLAKELDIPVIALAQLNREGESGRDGGEPRLSNLRDSGSLEQDADTVVFLWRKPDDSNPNLVNVSVAKQRNGPTGRVTLFFRKQFTRFESFEFVPEVPRY
jgi:replicative DNA helicase